ncbi:MAG: dTDP-4-dehydrorhamnose 3,5-epimerase [Vulcanimicrobiaceae bacterium]
MLRILPTKFEEAKLVEMHVSGDARGYFAESYSREKYAELGVRETFVQDSISRSHRNVVRGMHYDVRMAKLVGCVVGKIYDVIVDIREDSATYLHWAAYELSEENHLQIFVPRGFAHGFLALSDAVVNFKQNVYHDAAYERGVAWNDPALGIDWPLSGEPILSGKDRAWPPIKDTRHAK